jgi:hypothetical protein
MAELGYSKNAYLTPSRLLELHRDLWERLAPHERRSLIYLASHEANFFQPVVDRPAVLLSLVRQPVENVLSTYYFKRRSFWRAMRPLESIYARVSHGPGLRDLSNKQKFFNGQARSLLEPFYDTNSLQLTAGPSADADLWRERLFSLVDTTYLLGVSEYFDEFVALLARRLGWKKVFSPRVKANPDRPRAEELSPDLLRTVADYNWLDIELYDRQVAKLSGTAR